MKLFVTVFDLDSIRAIDADHDGIELRAENLREVDLNALRAATRKPIILTYRGSRVPDVEGALRAGIDFVDVEWREDVEIVAPERTVLSHHDYEGMRDVEAIMAAMRARGCAYTKLAATPQNFAENERLLALLPRRADVSSAPPGADGTSALLGMGERGLYSRILAPFRGSSLTFVAANALAAPGQLTLSRAVEIYGAERETLHAERVFAVVGNPAGHSLSPAIHNRLFREKRVPAAYTIASIESFDEITAAFLRGEPCGLSVTAPFKDAAFAFARDFELAPNARRARAVNTLVNLGDRILADNTDVDGFAALLPRGVKKAAVIGAGGTGRAALVALEDAGIPATVFNRTVSRGDAPLEALARFDGDLVINTLPPGVDAPVSPCCTYIEAAYGEKNTGGLALLHAQAVRQHELFMKVFDGL
ncbi:MAG TPA: type I 3-dehydroquinate dehydratase [Thermoanaerobaculia bacterium]|nr:type I 3-dehydroquinate dehydratase [Thermoanaerobaculia bacterium]